MASMVWVAFAKSSSLNWFVVPLQPASMTKGALSSSLGRSLPEERNDFEILARSALAYSLSALGTLSIVDRLVNPSVL